MFSRDKIHFIIFGNSCKSGFLSKKTQGQVDRLKMRKVELSNIDVKMTDTAVLDRQQRLTS